MTADLITRLRERADHIPGNGEFSQIGVLLREAADVLERKQEANLTLIEDAKRWARAYEKARDELAEAKDALEQAEKALIRINEITLALKLPHPGELQIGKIAREALAAPGGEEGEEA